MELVKKRTCMKKTVIAIGPTTQNNTVLHGVSMMFQLIIDRLAEDGINTKVIDIGKSWFNPKSNRTSGEFTLTKTVNYIAVLVWLLVTLLRSGKSVVYLTTAQSKVGFVRDFFIIRLCKIFGHKIIGQQFGANYDSFYNAQSPFFRRLITKTLQRLDLIVVEGDYTKELFNFLPDYETRVFVLPNGLPERQLQLSGIPKSILPGEPVRLFYLSNLIQSKGCWDVLEASKILIKEHGLNIHTVFAGKFLQAADDTMFQSSEEAKTAFLEYLDKEQLAGQITYYDSLYGAAKAKEFAEAHFFLLPSYYLNEGQPVSVLEALAYGCVPIVTQYRLIPMMVNTGNGFFVRPKSPGDIVATVLECAQHPDRYQEKSRQAIDTYTSRFTADKYTAQMLALFQRYD
jgi:glycosyltransferase involved in cell wall biosynthesis